MVIDLLSNSGVYRPLSLRIAKALDHLRQTEFSAIETGRYDIDGSAIFALVQDYGTKSNEEGKWEAHRKYIDLHYVAKGEERIGYAHVDRLVAGTYNDVKDVLFLSGVGDYLTIRTGMFAILFPEDAHMPGMQADARSTVRKVVVKIAVQ